MKTGGNFERCNVGSVEAHNLRTPEYLDSVQKSGKELYFFQHLTKNNTSWVNPDYEGKTCSQVFEYLVQLYKEKVGQTPQLADVEYIDKKTGAKKIRHGWSPIREAVIPIKEDTTLKDFDRLKKWLESKGLTVLRIDLHKDEGHIDEETGECKMNYHAHLVCIWVNLATGRSVKLDDKDMSQFQDQCAISLDMERGIPKEISGASHLTADQWKKLKELDKEVKKKEKQLQALDQRAEELQKKVEQKEKNLSALDKLVEASRQRLNSLSNEMQNAKKALQAVKNMATIELSTMKGKIEQGVLEKVLGRFFGYDDPTIFSDPERCIDRLRWTYNNSQALCDYAQQNGVTVEEARQDILSEEDQEEQQTYGWSI